MVQSLLCKLKILVKIKKYITSTEHSKRTLTTRRGLVTKFQPDALHDALETVLFTSRKTKLTYLPVLTEHNAHNNNTGDTQERNETFSGTLVFSTGANRRRSNTYKQKQPHGSFWSVITLSYPASLNNRPQ